MPELGDHLAAILHPGGGRVAYGSYEIVEREELVEGQNLAGFIVPRASVTG